MKLQLNRPTAGEFTHETEIPAIYGLGPKGGAATLRARCIPAGAANPAWTAAIEDMEVSRQVKEAELRSIVGESEPQVGEKGRIEADAHARERLEAARSHGQGMIGALYDACVIEWWSDIQNNGENIATDRDHFMALAEVRCPPVTGFFADLINKAIDSGKKVMEKTEGATKN